MLEHEYDFYLADTAAGKNIHFALRYQVYCLREHYEDPSLHPDFLEQDEYDESSAHFIARCRTTGKWLGAMRLIVGPPQHLPVTKFSRLNHEDSCSADRKNHAEASRLCIIAPAVSRANFVSNQPNSRRPLAPWSPPTKPLQTSWISLGLIRAARQYCLQHDITFCFFLISDPLARMLRRLGMEIELVGSPCQHRGWRSPYIHNVKTGYGAMSVRAPELYESFCQPDAYARYSDLVEDFEHTRMAAIG